MSALIALVGLLQSPLAAAQTALVLDGSLPNGRVDDLVALQPGPIYAIDQSMGEARGGNLFHSFRDFSIGPTDAAEFSSIQPFDNVILRVTGGNASTVNGTLRSTVVDSGSAGADFFFLNPAGILFGAGSQIDVPGHLYLSTADELRFDDGDVLDLRSAPAPVLSVAEPAEFGFLGGAAAANVELVENSSGGLGFLSLTMQPGKTLAAVAGDVRAAAPGGFLVVQTPGGRLGGVAVGSAEAQVDVRSLDLTTTEPGLLGNVLLEPGASFSGLDIGDPNGDQGEVFIRGGRFEISSADVTFGGNVGSGNPAIDIDVSDAISLTAAGAVLLPSRGAARGGDASIVAPQIEVAGTGSAILSQNVGPGGGGDILIQADRIVVRDQAQISTSVEPLGIDPSGAGGSVRIVADQIEVRDGGRLSSRTDTSGPGGDLDLVADRLEVLDGEVLARGNPGAPAGALRVSVEDIVVEGPLAEISTIQDWTGGIGGELALGTGSGSILVDRSGFIASQTRSDRTGSPIQISTGRLEIRDGGRVETSSLASGDAGAIEIDATTVAIGRSPGAAAGGLLVSSVAGGATGTGGQVQVKTGDLLVTDGGQITTRTLGGNAGSISVVADDEVRLSGQDDQGLPSGLSSDDEAGATGSGGNIDVSARTIYIDGGAAISTIATGSAALSSGNITLVARESISVVGSGQTSSVIDARGITGGAGDISLTAPQVLVADGARVDVGVEGSATGGRLTVAATDLVVRGGGPVGPAQLAAQANSDGSADGIDIALSGDLRMSAGALITTLSQRDGAAGDISIVARNARVDSGAEIQATALGSSDAGSIQLDVARAVELKDGRITTNAAEELGGQIDLDAGLRIRLDRSAVTSSVGQGVGNGGDLTLTAPYVVLNESQVIARAFRGNGGSIFIDTQVLVRSATSAIDARSTLSIDGEVSTTTPATDLSGQIANVGAAFLEAADQLRRDCAARTERVGSLTIGVAPSGPDYGADVLDLDRIEAGRRGADLCAP